MATIAIVSEYNPFHTGHKYQLDCIRRDFGDDACIIALMSGNYTQRGDIAIADKALRAKCAVLSGVNLCLELPFPFSISSAEIFARSAIHILNSLGTVDYISFGSESGDCTVLIDTARSMLTDEYKIALSELISSKQDKDSGYPALVEAALKRAFGEDFLYAHLTPNNILAIEYIKAIIESDSSIKIHTVKRHGADYNESDIEECEHQSATAIRTLLEKNDDSALDFVPEVTKSQISSAIKNGDMPCLSERISVSIISSLRLSSPRIESCIHDTVGGLYNRILAKSLDANTFSDLVRLSETKKFTQARIRRAIWYSYLGVTSSDMNELPAYTRMLATDNLGRDELKRIKTKSDFPIITKPSSEDGLPDGAIRQKHASDRADTIFQLTKPRAPHGAYSLTVSPFVLDRG